MSCIYSKLAIHYTASKATFFENLGPRSLGLSYMILFICIIYINDIIYVFQLEWFKPIQLNAWSNRLITILKIIHLITVGRL